MAFVQRPNSGSLFKNDRKTEPNHPDYTGSINVDGREFWISGWAKVGANGGKSFLSLAVNEKKPTEQPGPTELPKFDDEDFGF